MKTRLLTFACALTGASQVFAGTTTINFDDAPTGVDLGTHYAGIVFGAGEQAHNQILPFFPARSGTQDLVGTQTSNPNITFSFANPVTQLSFWYASTFGFSATAYAPDGKTVVGTFSGGKNVNTLDTTDLTVLLQSGLNTGVPDISSVVITDKSGVGTFISIDDLSFGTNNVPDAASTLPLLGAAGLGLLAFRRKLGA
jgi:hypothetical protein